MNKNANIIISGSYWDKFILLHTRELGSRDRHTKLRRYVSALFQVATFENFGSVRSGVNLLGGSQIRGHYSQPAHDWPSTHLDSALILS